MKTRALLVALALFGCALSGCAAKDATSNVESNLIEGDAEVNVDALNLRAGPGTEHAVLTVMAKGDRVTSRGESVNGFAAVLFNGIEGWAFEEFLTPIGPPRPPPAPGSLGEVVASLAAEAPNASPGTELGIAVMNLSTGEYAGAGDDVRHVSASSAKVMWVAAAMHQGAGVADIAGPIFESSDNFLSGTAIDRAGGIDQVNEIYWNVFGMATSITANWSFGHPRVAIHQGVLGGDNYFTPRDVITFMQKLDSGELLGDRTDELRGFMTRSPRSGWGGWMGGMLPEAARATMMHKAGWLPPPDFAAYSTLNDVGIIQVPDGHRYAIALLAHHGHNYSKQIRFVERASCVVYRSVSQDAGVRCND